MSPKVESRRATPSKEVQVQPEPVNKVKSPIKKANPKRKVSSFEEIVDFTTEEDLINQLHSQREKGAEEIRGPIRHANEAINKGKETKNQKKKHE